MKGSVNVEVYKRHKDTRIVVQHKQKCLKEASSHKLDGKTSFQTEESLLEAAYVTTNVAFIVPIIQIRNV